VHGQNFLQRVQAGQTIFLPNVIPPAHELGRQRLVFAAIENIRKGTTTFVNFRAPGIPPPHGLDSKTSLSRARG
jgi:hypothetical protein